MAILQRFLYESEEAPQNKLSRTILNHLDLDYLNSQDLAMNWPQDFFMSLAGGRAMQLSKYSKTGYVFGSRYTPLQTNWWTRLLLRVPRYQGQKLHEMDEQHFWDMVFKDIDFESRSGQKSVDIASLKADKILSYIMLQVTNVSRDAQRFKEKEKVPTSVDRSSRDCQGTQG
eukprot:TRINITY_DN5720_c0_g1_i1.p1 TRINITY_DN5720_c0_g1~~TRINITY_DN5720_c0_g1_i1.p1  ORF type:complete len:172 (+),score=23.07 TRINITY_DN5720_c0_g1_i1:100-615(+)